MGLKLVSAAANEPITLEDAKAFLRVSFDDDNELIEALISAARASAEMFTGRALVDQTWDYFVDEFPEESFIRLPRAPLLEVLSVNYGGAGNESVLSAAGYIVDNASAPARVALVSGGSWPTVTDIANGVRIRFRAGYVDNDQSPASGEIPPDIIAAIKLTIGSLYANREDVIVGQTAVELPGAARLLLNLHRLDTGMA